MMSEIENAARAIVSTIMFQSIIQNRNLSVEQAAAEAVKWGRFIYEESSKP